MSAFKSLTSQDVIVVPFMVNKNFSFVGSSSLKESEVFIERLVGRNLTQSLNINLEPTTGTTGSWGYSSSYYQRDLYNSIKQLYFTNELPNAEPEYTITDLNNNIFFSNIETNIHSRFDNYLETTLSSSRVFPTQSNAQIGIISIPSKLYGDYINPGSFYYRWKRTPSIYSTLLDDGEGRLIVSGTNLPVGIITYQHGIAVVTTTSLISNTFTSSVDVTCSFQSSRLVFETQYKCTIRENEFNYSLNPSLIKTDNYTNPLVSTCSLDIKGDVYGFVTGSSWAPYITTVGLYNENQELLAVAKMAQPVPTSRTTDMSILVNLDR